MWHFVSSSCYKINMQNTCYILNHFIINRGQIIPLYSKGLSSTHVVLLQNQLIVEGWPWSLLINTWKNVHYETSGVRSIKCSENPLKHCQIVYITHVEMKRQKNPASGVGWAFFILHTGANMQTNLIVIIIKNSNSCIHQERKHNEVNGKKKSTWIYIVGWEILSINIMF